MTGNFKQICSIEIENIIISTCGRMKYGIAIQKNESVQEMLGDIFCRNYRVS